jgi:putative ABC transport system ATP-binding protein
VKAPNPALTFPFPKEASSPTLQRGAGQREAGQRETGEDFVIQASDIRKVYKLEGGLEVHALRGVNLQIQRGQYAAIMGPSGSGKSTLLQIIGCLDIPSSGSYKLANQEVAQFTEDELSVIRNKRIGFIFQSYNLLPRANALDNVALPLMYRGTPIRERNKKAKLSLERVGLGDRLDHRPNQLSGGQKQRVAIARALATDPDILLADEPTGNLDSKTGEEILGLFQELHAEGRTILMVTHEPDVAAHCEVVVRIKDGVVASVDKVENRKLAVATGEIP